MTEKIKEFGDLAASDMEPMVVNLMQQLTAMDGHKIPPGAALGMSDEYFDAMYTLGIRYYGNARYKDAKEIFQNLTTLQPENVRNFKGLGACYLGLQDYRSAVNAYTAAYTFSAMDADTSFYLGQAFFLLKDYEEAEGHLRFSEELARRAPSKWPDIEKWSAQLLERTRARLHSPKA
jgi:tetratricopeptide (TPR) repeat protein